MHGCRIRPSDLRSRLLRRLTQPCSFQMEADKRLALNPLLIKHLSCNSILLSNYHHQDKHQLDYTEKRQTVKANGAASPFATILEISQREGQAVRRAAAATREEQAFRRRITLSQQPLKLHSWEDGGWFLRGLGPGLVQRRPWPTASSGCVSPFHSTSPCFIVLKPHEGEPEPTAKGSQLRCKVLGFANTEAGNRQGWLCFILLVRLPIPAHRSVTAPSNTTFSPLESSLSALSNPNSSLFPYIKPF